MTYWEKRILIEELPDGRTLGEVWLDENEELLPFEEWSERGVRGRRDIYDERGVLVVAETIEGPYRGDEEDPG